MPATNEPIETDPRVEIASYVIRPTGYHDLVHSDKDMWCLHVINGQAWGWSVRRHPNDSAAMNRKGEFVYETRGSAHNKARRWTAAEAIALALKFVDVQRINGCTAVEASARVAARLGVSS